MALAFLRTTTVGGSMFQAGRPNARSDFGALSCDPVAVAPATVPPQQGQTLASLSIFSPQLLQIT
jgi:hypothetical protein